MREQPSITEEFGDAGVVEVVVLCGLYAITGYTVTAFDIAVEDGLFQPPFWPLAACGHGSASSIVYPDAVEPMFEALPAGEMKISSPHCNLGWSPCGISHQVDEFGS